MRTDLEPVRLRVHALLLPYEKKKLKVTGDSATSYSLSSTRKIETLGREYDGMFFAGWRILKEAVGFYFMPIYTHESEFNDLSPELRRLLKGKSCFHLKKEDPLIESQLKDLLKKGYEVYKKAGWV